MNLALPAPRVEEAIASKVEPVEPATAEMARPSNSIVPVTTPLVEPATIVSAPPTTTEGPQSPTPTLKTPTIPSSLSVEGLRLAPGTNHFESEVAVLPRAPHKNLVQLLLPCLYDDRNFVTFGEAKKYCFVKDTVCYVFSDPTDPRPLYQISLSLDDHPPSALAVTMEDPYHPHPYSTTISPQPDTNLPRAEMATVLLLRRRRRRTNSSANSRNRTNDLLLLYQFTFDTSQDRTRADRFRNILHQITSG